MATLILPAYATPPPSNAVGTYGDNVAFWMRKKLKVVVGPWQKMCLDAALYYDDHGDLIVSTALFSTARQNGKTTIVRAVFDWMLAEGHKLPAFREWVDMLCAAHDAGQARVVYRAVQRDMLKLYVPTYGAGQRKAAERLRITDYFGIEIGGLTLDTATSQPGSARGITAGMIAWDEMLTQRSWGMWEALSPAQSAVPNPMMLLTSTAGYSDSVVLRALYERGIRQATGAERPDPAFLMLWWQADDDDVGLDWGQLRKANPALDDGRLQRAKIAAEWSLWETNNRGSWIRERLNRWSDDREDPAFSPEMWGACRVANPLAKLPGPFTLAVEVTADWTDATIAVAAMRKDSKVGVEIHHHFEGTASRPITGDEVCKVLSAFAEKHEIARIAYPAASALAPSLARHAALTGLPYLPLAAVGIPPACADYAEAVGSQRLAHDDPLLDQQQGWAARRFVGHEGGWRWAVTASAGPITAVIAATLASSVAARVPARVQAFF